MERVGAGHSKWRSHTSSAIHFALAAITVLGLLAMLPLLVLSFRREYQVFEGSFISTFHGFSTIFTPALASFIAAPGAAWLVANGRAATWHLRLASVYAMLNWLFRLSSWLWPLLEYESFPAVVNGVCAAGLLISMVASGGWLMIMRLEALEAACLVNLRSRLLKRVFVAICCLCVATVISFFIPGNGHRLVMVSLIFSAAFLWILIFQCSLFRSMQLAKRAYVHAPEGRAAQAKSMHRALCRELLCTNLMMLSSTVFLFAFLDDIGLFDFAAVYEHPWLIAHAASIVDTACNEWFALNLSGAISGAVRGSAARAAGAKERARRRQSAEASWRDHRQGTISEEWEQWDAKVLELAGRGISLEALLRFYRDLPRLMPHYDALRHTTSDVVRGAIIPFSAAEQSACASVLMKRAFTLPNKMVTHNWSNLFRDLVAAILADGLGESEFSMIAALLQSDLDRLESWVAHAKVGGRTYWVCAFSVNQHVGICGSVRGRDSVSGEPFQACACGREKALNDTEPLLPDGRSIPCQMNKFDDMMKFLAATRPDFEQVLAIDSRFKLFSWAWCVAEIATANWAGMMQRLKVHSQEAMSTHAEELRSLKIQEMEASRAEDKQAILEGIQDLDVFNARLQALLFEELFPAWSSLDAEERMASAGFVIRWLSVWAASAGVEPVSNAP